MSKRERCTISMSQVMQPHQANVAGNVHGGEIMKFMDTTAAAVAMKYSKSSCVTARVDELEFHLPILVGSMVTCTASIVYTGRTSMEVFVNVEVEDLKSDRDAEKALSAYFTLVAMGNNGRPQSVPEFVAQTEEEERLYGEAELRKEQHKQKRQK